MFLISLGDAYFQISIHLNSQPYLWIALKEKALTVLGSGFLLFDRSPGRHHGVLWAHRRGIHLLRHPGQLTGDGRVSSSPSATSGDTAPALSGPEDCHQLGKVRPRVIQQGSVFWVADRPHPREGLSDELSDCQIPGSYGQFRLLLQRCGSIFCLT